MKPLMSKLAVAVMAMALAACQATPGTGRSQLILTDESEAEAQALDLFNEAKREWPRSSNVGFRNAVEKVGRRIAEATGRTDYQWEFHATDSDEVNAFCLPGGKVVVHIGIGAVAGNETGLAVVIGHEVAHAIARHGVERVSQGKLAAWGALALGLLGAAAAGSVGGDMGSAFDTTYNLSNAGAELGILRPYSRTQESEADQLGLTYMAKAGYDPRAAPGFWERMAASAGGRRPPEFLSTHPSPDTRIRDIEAWLPDALQHYQPRQPAQAAPDNQPAAHPAAPAKPAKRMAPAEKKSKRAATGGPMPKRSSAQPADDLSELPPPSP